MIARASLEIAACRASVIFSGQVSRIQRLPSSNSGMNSRPSDGSRHAVQANNAAKNSTVSQRCLKQTPSGFR